MPCDRFDAAITVFNLEGMLFARMRFGTSHFGRCPPRFTGAETDCITIQLYMSGCIQGRAGDQVLRMGPDEVCLQDFAVP